MQAAAALVRPDSLGDMRLVGYIVSHPDHVITVSHLRGHLAPRLPDHKIPTAFVFLEQMPLNPFSKVDRNALPEPGRERPRLDAAYAPPRTPVEERLARIWADVLDLEQVGIHDDFLELGGHSLWATSIITRVVDAFQTDVALSALFQSPTVAEMALVIVQQWAEAADPAVLQAGLAGLDDAGG